MKTVTTGETSVKVSWDRVKGANGYELYRARDGKSFKRIKTFKSGSTLTYSNTGLLANTEYFYRIKAYKVKAGKKVYGRYSWSKQGNAGIPQELRGFSAYSSDANTIFTHWYYDKWAEGVLIYRSTSKAGPYKQIGKTLMTVNEGYWYDDSSVTPGKTYYYKARPYITYKGKVIKGKYTKVSGQPAVRKHPQADGEILSVSGQPKELIFKLTLKDYGYDTEFFIMDAESLGKLDFYQHWQNGTAEESRSTEMKLTGLSRDGEVWQDSGSIVVKPKETVYVKAYADDDMVIGGETRAEWSIYVNYNGKRDVLSNF